MIETKWPPVRAAICVLECTRCLQLIGQRRADVREEALIVRSILQKILSRFTKSQRTVWITSRFVSIMFILPVVMPKADGTNLVGCSAPECLELAAGASIRRRRLHCCGDIPERLV
jgi:hypothetical protein